MVYLGKAKVKDMYIDAKSELFSLARDMRNNPTVPERILWKHLRKFHSNDQPREYDDNQSGELERFGIQVIRFRNEEIIDNLEHVLSMIRLKIDELASPALTGSGGREGVRPLK